MALNPGPVGSAIASFIESQLPSPGVKDTPATVEVIWQGIVSLIYSDIKANAEIVPNTFSAPNGPVTGEGKVT